MRIAFVLLAEPELPTADAVSSAMRDDELTLVDASDSTDDSEMKDSEIVTLSVSTGGALLVALMRAPVPNEEADAAAEQSMSSMGEGWKLPAHTAHLLVTYMGDEEPDAVISAHKFTQVLAAVTRASGAVGVYWGDARATHAPDFFLELATDPVPLMLWTGISIARTESNVSILSLGMAHVGFPNMMIEAPPSDASDALGFLFDMLGYVVKRGEALPDGDTIGRTAEEKLKVEYVESPMAGDDEVARIRLPG